ncbi:glutamate carboxypeptidase 2-like isoform X4 [Babylonia areolata]|uniref:glutamate carboxypeptidase 2-like isoform X1 n=1 Tax=Babylonia areolata TaxID=304850 RepID=UPI003FD699B2
MATVTGKLVAVVVAVVVTVLCFVTGLFIGWFFLDHPASSTSEGSDSNMTHYPPSSASSSSFGSLGQGHVTEPDPTVSARLIQEVQASNIEQYLRVLSERPHLAGTEGDERTVDYVEQELKKMGYDVTLAPYDVLLSYPAKQHFNKVTMLDGRRRNAIFTSDVGATTGSDWDSEVTPPYCMYCPSGKVQGKLIYANYGRAQDFRTLEKLKVDVNKAIVIMRYGKISRGKKVREAAKRGGKAVVLFNDPADVNINMTYNVYPATWWLPEDDVEHGNFRTSWGDPATPGRAAVDGAYRIPEKQMDLPSVPCHPVSYRDARILLQNLEGEKAPEEWQGQLGFEYHVGSNTPGALPVEVDVKNNLETRRVYNVLATLPGATEPDRVVLVGNHRDAIAYGALDPGSGTAVMLEVARAFMALYTQGWRPRRTVMFCSWAAEEFGVIGSTEWVEERRRWLGDRAVAYLNLDTVLQGNYSFDVSATPSLQAAVIRAAGKVTDPHQPDKTVLDVWRTRITDDRSPGLPWIRRPVSMTDFQPFIHLVGVPVTHSRYSFVEQDGSLIYPVRNYPLYHTVYDTFPLAAMMDPDLAVSTAVAAIMAELTRDLADSPILPLVPRDFATDIATHMDRALQSSPQELHHHIYYLKAAINDFLTASTTLQSHIDSLELHTVDPFQVRRINDKLMLYEREFVDHQRGQHLILSHGSNSNPSLDEQTMSDMIQAFRAATHTLST